MQSTITNRNSGGIALLTNALLGSLLLIGVAKIYLSLVAPIDAKGVDPVFFFPLRSISRWTGLIDIGVALPAIFVRNLRIKALLLGILGAAFLGYHAAAFLQSSSPYSCPCLAAFSAALRMNTRVLTAISELMAFAYFLTGVSGIFNAQEQTK